MQFSIEKLYDRVQLREVPYYIYTDTRQQFLALQAMS
jgi:hypothetical protein